MKMSASISVLVRLMTNDGVGKLKLGPEEYESVKLANYLRELTLTGKIDAVWMHVPNELAGQNAKQRKTVTTHGTDVQLSVSSDSGAKRNSRLAQIRYTIAKAMGLIPGAADYLFLTKQGSYCIEMKSKTGKQTSNQADFQAWCEAAGVPYAVARSAEEALLKLAEWGVIQSAGARSISASGAR